MALLGRKRSREEVDHDRAHARPGRTPTSSNVRVLDDEAAATAVPIGCQWRRMLQESGLPISGRVEELIELVRGLFARTRWPPTPSLPGPGYGAGRPVGGQALGRGDAARAVGDRDRRRPRPGFPGGADRGDGCRDAPRVLGRRAAFAAEAGRSSSRPTTWKRPTRSPTGSSSCTAADRRRRDGRAMRSRSRRRQSRSARPRRTGPRRPAWRYDRRHRAPVDLARRSDATARGLFLSRPRVHDLESRAPDLEDAFVALTRGDRSRHHKEITDDRPRPPPRRVPGSNTSGRSPPSCDSRSSIPCATAATSCSRSASRSSSTCSIRAFCPVPRPRPTTDRRWPAYS